MGGEEHFLAGLKSAGRGKGENTRGGAKERIKQLIQKFEENKLVKLRRHASRVHFAKIYFGEIHFGKIH